jgi:hypothetical protein
MGLYNGFRVRSLSFGVRNLRCRVWVQSLYLQTKGYIFKVRVWDVWSRLHAYEVTMVYIRVNIWSRMLEFFITG